MALVGIELETLVSESDALTTRPPPCALIHTASLSIQQILSVQGVCVSRFQSYEYTISKIFIACGT